VIEATTWIGATMLVWFIARRIRKHANTPLLDPVLLSVAVLIGALLLLDVPYERYERGGRVISFFLGPAVVALAVPLYRNVQHVRRHLGAILASVAAGAVVGILSASGIVYLMGGSWLSVRSAAPKSVTTPIAMELSAIVAGSPPLTISIVIITGILGAVFGPQLIRLMRIRNPVAEGLAVGTAAHGIGTARAYHEGELQGAMSGIGMTLNGIVTAVILGVLSYVL
jgi:predicted murein hydrolase (TIGR00659 family)